jgi:hypothetical protein
VKLRSIITWTSALTAGGAGLAATGYGSWSATRYAYQLNARNPNGTYEVDRFTDPDGNEYALKRRMGDVGKWTLYGAWIAGPAIAVGAAMLPNRLPARFVHSMGGKAAMFGAAGGVLGLVAGATASFWNHQDTWLQVNPANHPPAGAQPTKPTPAKPETKTPVETEATTTTTTEPVDESAPTETTESEDSSED